MKNFEIIEKICGGSGEYGIGDIVRCKDCEYYKPNEYANGAMYCMCWCDWLPTEDDDFCSFGEKRETKNEQ